MDTSKGKPLAVLVNWTAHPTFMDEEDMLFSGDWPGHLQRTVEALIGQGVIAMYYNGAEGDQSPTPPAEAGSRWERAERYGREMGIQAWRIWEKTKPREVKELAWHTETIALPKIAWHPDFMKTGGAEYGLNETMIGGFLSTLQPTRTRSTAFRLGGRRKGTRKPYGSSNGLGNSRAASPVGLKKLNTSTATGLRNLWIGGARRSWNGSSS